tara:strand:- start:8635 stop:9057 length:423 start_codon:yes stop_codon:yes gene_type:complete
LARVNAQEYAEKWGRRLTASTEDIRRGVERVTEAPGERAARSQEKMITNLLDSVNSGRWARAVSSVTLPEWKESILSKGIQRIAAGVTAALPRQVQMAQTLLANVEAVQAEVERMPNVTFEDRLARMDRWARGMHERPVK